MSEEPDVEAFPLPEYADDTTDKAETKRWMDKYRGKRYFRRFFNSFGDNLTIIRDNWVNFERFGSFLAESFSLYSVVILGFAMYYSLEHLKSGDFWAVLAGAILCIALGWINHMIGRNDA